MRQGTTPQYVLTVKGRNLRNQTVFVTIKDKSQHIITKTGEDLDVAYANSNSTITFRLSQEETFQLNVGTLKVQVRFIDANGIADATNCADVQNLDVLLKKVIQYGEAI